MSYVVYGGILMETNLVRWDRDIVADGPTYLYTNHTLALRSWFTPGKTSYTFQVKAPARPGGKVVSPVSPVITQAPWPGGVDAPVTDTSIRALLVQPRQPLLYLVGSRVALLSPAPDPFTGNSYPCDVDNGPKVLHCNVAEVKGTKTFLIDFVVQTAVNEAVLFANPTSVILSHRWDMEESTDQDYYPTRYIRGHAIFRADRLNALVLTEPSGRRRLAVPDDFRDYLFHPLPKYYRRVGFQVIPHADGNRLDYVLVDRGVRMAIGADAANKGVTRIECTQSASLDEPGAVEQARGAWEGPRQGSRLGGELADVEFLVNEAKAAGAILGAGAGAWLGATFAAMPTVTNTVTVRVWGSPVSTRTNLQAVAERVGNDVVSARVVRGITGHLATHITHDRAGTYVEVRKSVSAGPATQVLSILASVASTIQEDLGFSAPEADTLNHQAIKDFTAPGLAPFFTHEDAGGPGGGLGPDLRLGGEDHVRPPYAGFDGKLPPGVCRTAVTDNTRAIVLAAQALAAMFAAPTTPAAQYSLVPAFAIQPGSSS